MLNKTLYHDLQKARRASLLSAGDKTLPRSGNTDPAFIRSASFTLFIAGPLGKIQYSNQIHHKYGQKN